jgi:PAS domain S-box-containing protein
VLRIFLPTIIAIALFLIAFWIFILPSFENTLLDRKREMIKELTNSALSILRSYERDERNGLYTREEAQNLAISRIETLRYGPEGKDYFWIQDLEPKMVMHPYRPDLNGQDLSDFADPRGAKIFVEFASQVKRSGEGYIDYVWQWKDDPTRLEPKESYVKGFAPWGWIIGTGIYTDDVGQEIARIEQNLIFTSLGISGAIILLLLFVLQQSLRIEKERQKVLDNLRESTDRYHALVEVTTEGTLLVLEGHCRYANPTFLSLLGYTSHQMEFLELTDLLPKGAENSLLWDTVLAREGAPSFPGKPIEGFLKRIDGTLVECVLTLNPIEYDDQEGFILLAKDVTRQPESVTMSGLAEASETFPIGLFRARAVRRGVFLAINSYGRTLLAQVSMDETQQPALADLFSDPEEYQEFFHSLASSNNMLEHILHLETVDATARFVSLSARMILDESGQPEFITGFLRDVTDSQKLEAEREALVTRLQSSLLFLHEPLSTLGRDVVFCPMETTIQQLSKTLTARNASAALVSGGNMSVVGIVTDHDLRARVLAEDLDVQSPIYTIMTAPVSRISETALVYEALIRMEENRVRYLAVEGQGGEIINLIDNKSLIQYQRFAPIVLSREILRANTAEEVAAYSGRTNPLVKSVLASSAQPRHATQLLAAISDAATTRLIQLAIEKIGDPPVPFAFITMGSHGRQEQTLVTDQDNGIIYHGMPDQDPNTTRDYFLRLGNLVCDGLDRAGYPYCRGNIMANNPRWCRSIGEWQAGFDEWVRKSEPQEVMEFTISLDFRIVFGDETLTRQLREHIQANLLDVPAFYYQLAQNAVQFKPPFRLLGNVYLSGGSSDNPGDIDLKDALMPVISFARLYALRHQINQTHTIDRLIALSQKNLLQRSSLEEITTAYDFLMRLRFQNQISCWEAGKPINNNIHPAKLGHIQQELLKQAFAQIAAIQKKISYDFLGGI